MEKHTPYFTPLLTILCENKPGYARKQNLQRLTKPEISRKTKKCEVMQQ